MDQREDLRVGVAEMRSVARRLENWAEYLESTFLSQETNAAEVSASEPRPVKKKKEAANPAGPEPGAAPEKGKALTLPEVRAILAEKCAAGFGTQVKALIESYGASSLKGVPAEKYEELLEAVKGLGDADAG